MSRPFPGALCAALLLLSARSPLLAQQRQHPADSTHADSARQAAQLNPVQILATPAERAEPVSATHVSSLAVRQTPAWIANA